MPATLKQMSDFLIQIGADQVSHTDKGYLAHAIGVYNDLKKWACDEELTRVGVLHSIYGTELFQRFTLPLERRDEVRELIGDRAELIAYLNCAMDRTHFDAELLKSCGPYQVLDRFTGEAIDVADEDFHDLCVVHLCDWLEQVERSQHWDYRREGYRALAERLGGIALESYDRVFAREQLSDATH